MKKLIQKTELLNSAVIYLDKFGHFQQIKETCLLYQNTQAEVVLYSFVVEVSACDLLQVDASLGNLLLCSPNDAVDLFQEAVYNIIQTLSLLSDEVVKTQICVTLRLLSLPAIPEIYSIGSLQDLSYQTTGGFLQLDGVVTGITALSSYTRSTLYYCPIDGCRGSDGKQYIRVHVPGALEVQTIRNDFTCFHCGMLLEEDKSKRVLADKLVAEVVPSNILTLDGGREIRRTQAVPVYCRDDLASVPIVGEKYKVIGLVRSDYDNQKVVLALEISSQTIECLQLKHLPSTINQLWEDQKPSPWRFVMSLAYLFGSKKVGSAVSPPGTFLKLKLGILLSLSLVGLESKQSSQAFFHILAVGRETVFLRRLLSYGSWFTERAIQHNSSNPLTGRVTTDRYGNSPYFIEGGSMALATGGVCDLGELSAYKKPIKDTIKSTLDSGRVVVDVGSKFSHGLPHQHLTPLLCQVWAYADPLRQKPSQQRGGDDLFVTGDTGDLPKSLLDVFGMVFFTDSNESSIDSTLTEELATKIVQSSLDDDDDDKPLITCEDFKKYLELARSREVLLTPPAEVILQGYYQAIRRMRSSGLNGSTVPVSALTTLYAVSLAHAKLSLRDKVSEGDAVMAVRLYEEYITARYGFSILSIQPMPHVVGEIMPQYSFGEELDKQMYQFHINLVRFCGGADCRKEHEE